jgi:hypothetical protein
VIGKDFHRILTPANRTFKIEQCAIILIVTVTVSSGTVTITKKKELRKWAWSNIIDDKYLTAIQKYGCYKTYGQTDRETCVSARRPTALENDRGQRGRVSTSSLSSTTAVLLNRTATNNVSGNLQVWVMLTDRLSTLIAFGFSFSYTRDFCLRRMWLEFSKLI